MKINLYTKVIFKKLTILMPLFIYVLFGAFLFIKASSPEFYFFDSFLNSLILASYITLLPVFLFIHFFVSLNRYYFFDFLSKKSVNCDLIRVPKSPNKMFSKEMSIVVVIKNTSELSEDELKMISIIPYDGKNVNISHLSTIEMRAPKKFNPPFLKNDVSFWINSKESINFIQFESIKPLSINAAIVYNPDRK